ncbi:MAG: nuclear transport factor 2 family protein [Pseudomonadota bacterium]
MNKTCTASLFALVPALGLLALPLQCTVAATPATAMEQRLRTLEDREQIRALLNDYGRLLDERNFEGFGKLFAATGEYHSGAITKGPKAIGDSLRDIMGRNPLGFKEPNFHVFFNVYIDVKGDRATSTSQSVYLVPSEGNKPELALMASYQDDLVREDGQWKFQKRVVRGHIPVPKPRP